MPTNPGVLIGSNFGALAQSLGGQDKGVCVQMRPMGSAVHGGVSQPLWMDFCNQKTFHAAW